MCVFFTSYDVCEFNFYLSVVMLICAVLIPNFYKLIADFLLGNASLKGDLWANQAIVEVGHAPIEPVCCDDVGVVRDKCGCVFTLVFLHKHRLVVEVLGGHQRFVVAGLLV